MVQPAGESTNQIWPALNEMIAWIDVLRGTTLGLSHN